MSYDSAPPHKILLIGPKAPPYGGMALQAEQLRQLLSGDGHEVLLFASNLPFPRVLQFVDRLRGIRPFVRSAVITAKLLREIPRHDVVHVLAASWLYFFLVAAPAVVLSRMFGRRVVLNYRSGEGPQFFEIYGWLVAPVFWLADSVTAPSGFLAESIRSHFRVPVTIVRNIVDLSRFRFRERARFEPRLLVTRHLERLYGVETVLEAFREIQKKYPDASLDIAGTGSEDGRLRSLTREWGLLNVRFLGHVPHGDLPGLYDRCDILLNASRADNFPGSLVEASVSGLPVVSTNVGGIAFLYENETNAILVEPGDWHSLADGVNRILQDPSLGRQLVAAGFKLSQECDWKQVRQSLYECYAFPPARAESPYPLRMTQ